MISSEKEYRSQVLVKEVKSRRYIAAFNGHGSDYEPTLQLRGLPVCIAVNIIIRLLSITDSQVSFHADCSYTL